MGCGAYIRLYSTSSPGVHLHALAHDSLEVASSFTCFRERGGAEETRNPNQTPKTRHGWGIGFAGPYGAALAEEGCSSLPLILSTLNEPSPRPMSSKDRILHVGFFFMCSGSFSAR